MRRGSLEADLVSSILSKSSSLPSYKNGGNRMQASKQTSLLPGSSAWAEQQVNELFKQGDYTFIVPVKGKTSNYKVTIQLIGFLDSLNRELETTKDTLTSNLLQRVLQRNMSISKARVSCTCPDFKYRYAYAMSLAGDKAGEQEGTPSIKTNPQNLQGGCKHIISVLSNRAWIPQIAMNLYSYIMDIYSNNKQLFDSIIRPALNGITDERITNKNIATEDISDQVNQYYYADAGFYDDDQNLMISIARENGADVLPYITPNNSPQQILEISKAYKEGIQPQILERLADISLSPKAIRVLSNTLRKWGLNWIRFSNLHPDILEYLSDNYGKFHKSPEDLNLTGEETLGQIKNRIRS